MGIKIIPYAQELKDEWNSFVSEADNGCFLFDRNYMDYHSDRFFDCSSLLLQDEKIVAVFPAHREGALLSSHSGLTYAGLVTGSPIRLRHLIDLFCALLEFYENDGIKEVIYKVVPDYLRRTGSDPEHFVLSLLDAKLTRVDTSYVLACTTEPVFQERRRRGVTRGQKSNTVTRLDDDFQAFWNRVLIPNLRNRYDAKPVHTLEEIQLLHDRFPERIRQANAYIEDQIVAGVTLFYFGRARHCQYISSNEEGRDTGALDYLTSELINSAHANRLAFSLGTANNRGNDLNPGVSEWKEGWGASIHAHFHYRFSMENLPALRKYSSDGKN